MRELIQSGMLAARGRLEAGPRRPVMWRGRAAIGSRRVAGRRADPLKPSPFPQWRRVEPGVTPLPTVAVEDITPENIFKK